MKMLEIPTREVPVVVRLDNETQVRGCLFVEAQGPHGGPGLASRRLNDDEQFLPLSSDREGFLLNKGRIQTVRLERADEEFAYLDAEAAHRSRVRVELTDGKRLEGELSYAMPLDRGRVVDYLNAGGDRFIPLVLPDGLMLVNTDHIVRVFCAPS